MSRDKLRCVLDTNVLISAAITPGLSRRVVSWAFSKTTVLVSLSSVNELSTRLVLRSKFDRYLSQVERQAFVTRTLKGSEMIEVKSRLEVCSDPDDNRFVELAHDGQADFLITGNRKDFPDTFEDVQIVTPREFATIIGLE